MRITLMWWWLSVKYWLIDLCLVIVGEDAIVNRAARFYLMRPDETTPLEALLTVLNLRYRPLSYQVLGDWHTTRLLMLVERRASEIRGSDELLYSK
jgi:hypothetical protein